MYESLNGRRVPQNARRNGAPHSPSYSTTVQPAALVLARQFAGTLTLPASNSSASQLSTIRASTCCVSLRYCAFCTITSGPNCHPTSRNSPANARPKAASSISMRPMAPSATSPNARRTTVVGALSGESLSDFGFWDMPEEPRIVEIFPKSSRRSRERTLSFSIAARFPPARERRH